MRINESSSSPRPTGIDPIHPHSAKVRAILERIEREFQELLKQNHFLSEQNKSLNERVKILSQGVVTLDKLIDINEQQIIELAKQITILLLKEGLLQKSLSEETTTVQRLLENTYKKAALDTKLQYLYREHKWGEEIVFYRPLLSGTGALIGHIPGFALGTVLGLCIELGLNRDKHFSPEYLERLKTTEKQAKDLCKELGEPIPQWLECPWWEKNQSLIQTFFGRNFCFQDS